MCPCENGPMGWPLCSQFRFAKVGLYGAISGAKSAVTMKASTTKAPSAAGGFRRSCTHASDHSPVGASSWISWDSISATDTSRVPNPRIDDRVREVDQEIHD